MRDDGEGDERRLKYFPFNASFLRHSLAHADSAAERIEKFNYEESGVEEMDRFTFTHAIAVT